MDQVVHLYSVGPLGANSAGAVSEDLIGKEGCEHVDEAGGAAVELVGAPLVVEAGRNAIKDTLGQVDVASRVLKSVVVEEVGSHDADIDICDVSLIEPAVSEPGSAELIELTLEALLEEMLPLGEREGGVVLTNGVLNELAPSAVVEGRADVCDLGGPVVTTLVVLEESVVSLALHCSDEVEEVINLLGSAELRVEVAEGVTVVREEVAVVEAGIGVGNAKITNILPE